MKKTTAIITIISALILSSCTDKGITFITPTITGDKTNDVSFSITPPAGFVIADGGTAATPIQYDTSVVYDANGTQLIGDITSYCDLNIIDGSGNSIQATTTSGTTYEGGVGYVQISGCSQPVSVAASGIFKLNNRTYQIDNTFVTITAQI